MESDRKTFMDFLDREPTRIAYASDASMYAIKPRAVIPIRSARDVVEAVTLARREHLSVVARGGGTGLTGGAVGRGYILDFSHFREVLEISPETRTVQTRAGIIYDDLNRALGEYGLFFPPDPSSGDSCQIGGILSNNASGSRSVKYGLTADFVEELEIVDARGEILALKKYPVESAELKWFYRDNPAFERVFNLIGEGAELIKQRWPRLKKNSAGYNLHRIVTDLDRGIVNLPALMVGAEGTLGLILTARLRLLPCPVEQLTARIYFKSLVTAGEAVPGILKLAPSGLEIVDGSTLDLIGREKHCIPPEAAALLLVEFDDDLENRRREFEQLTDRLELAAPPDYAADRESAAPLWKARKAIVPTLYRHHPTRRPVSLVEDVSLPSDEVPGFIEYITDLFDGHGLTYGIFGHIGDGNLHIRPLFDLNDPDEFRLARDIYNRVYERVIAVGGGTTAEHADGRLRAPVLKKMYGAGIYDLFVNIKKLLDPDGLFSPGTILGTTTYTADIDYEKIKLYCAACGKCNGYCPAYALFRREDFSPRGWLRMIHQVPDDRRELDEYLSYCLNCKNCTEVCPAGVDIASEIMHYRSEHPSALAETIASLADNDGLLSLGLKLGRWLDPIINSSAGRKLKGLVGDLTLGFDGDLKPPKAAARSLRRRHPDRIAEKGEVAFFHGCADNLFESAVGEALFRVFDHLEIPLLMPEQKCCGLPYEVYGLRDNLIEKARFNIDHLREFEAVVTGCASCLLRLKEYADLFDPDDDYHRRAQELAGRCFDISQYLNRREIDWGCFNGGAPLRVTYHNPCHLRAAGLHREPEKMLDRLDGVEIIHAAYADRCCSQAGSYGYLHHRESKLMFADKRKAYEKIDADYLMTSCPSCQMKIRAETNGRFRVVHPVEILAARLNKS